MSHYLEDAAILDRDRAASLAANDAAMGVSGELRPFIVKIRKRGGAVTEFPCMSHSSCEAVAQHADLLQSGERMSVRPVGALA